MPSILLSSLGLQNFDLLSVAVAIAAMGVLGFVVFLQNRKSTTSQHFFCLSLTIIFWSAVNYAAYKSQSSVTILWLLRLVMFFAVWFAFTVFNFLYAFPDENKKFPVWYKVIFIPLAIITAVVCLTPLVFSEVMELSPAGGASRVANGPGIILFGLTALVFNLSGITSLLIKTTRAVGQEKLRYKYVLSGVFITLALIAVFNFILPAFFDNPRFIPLSALFIFPFVAFTSYAILRYKLFNIRVVGTAVLIFLLSVVTFSEVIFANDFALIVYRSAVFLLVLVFGILLIRDMLREVEQREKLTTLNEKLQVAYKEVERLSKAKSEFISIASHQLRTPLTAIKGYISMILEGSYGKIVDRAKIPIENVYKSNQRLINLVNDLLSISRIESGKMGLEPEESSIEEIIMGAIDDLKITAEKKKLYLKFEKPTESLPKIMLDKDKMRQVILNLVDNAIKYTPKGGVAIEAQILDSRCRILIRDTGEGMNEEELTKIFESFSRGTVGTKAYTEGVGLGLYIARRFVEMHRGRVWAESEGKDKGSTFYIELPMM